MGANSSKWRVLGYLLMICVCFLVLSTTSSDAAVGDCGCLPGECPPGTECIGASTLCLVSCTCPVCAVCAGICCGDNNLCTIDSVDPAIGCVYTPKTCLPGETCDPATGACIPFGAPVDTINNNLTVVDTSLDAGGSTLGGTNDVHFTWDGTRKTSVAVSGQVSNATLSSSCLFFGYTWSAHDVVIYGPGTYTVYTDCPPGSPGCGLGTPITFTVNAGEIGGHILLDWGLTKNYDIVNVWQPKAVFGPSALWTGACGSNPADKVWDWMSRDVNGDGINGYPGITSEPSAPGTQANFNLMERADLCAGVVCPAVMVCNSPLVCDPATGQCVPEHPSCDDNNACTTDSCNPTTGCVHTPVVCNDNNLCTIDICNPATGCVYTPKDCNDNNVCTVDSCDPATGCVHTPVNGDDYDACTIDFCDPAVGIRHVPIVCDDNNACTTDSCDRATGCVFTPIVCNDNNACTADTCDPATGCVYTPIVCDDNNACTTDTCDPATGCKFTLIPGSTKTVTIRGGGQKPTTVDLEIQTQFTVMNDGCIVGSTVSSVTVTPGTALLVNVNAGIGPPPYCTWNGIPLEWDYRITAPDVGGDVGKLICDNKANGGKDVDRMTVSVQ